MKEGPIVCRLLPRTLSVLAAISKTSFFLAGSLVRQTLVMFHLCHPRILLKAYLVITFWTIIGFHENSFLKHALGGIPLIVILFV